MGPSAIGAGRASSAIPDDEPNQSIEDPEDLVSRADDETETEDVPDTLPDGGSSRPRTPVSDNNAQRTRERNSREAYADAGYTSSGDGVFAGVALRKNMDPGGVEREALSASAQFGAQNEIQVAGARVGGGTEIKGMQVSYSGETSTARLNAGIYNDDDSVGANLGAMATAVGIEGTARLGGWQVTLGASLSAGAAVSSGERNIDGDATIERCFKGSVGWLTLGFCSEL